PDEAPHVTPGTGEPDLSADGFQAGIYYRIKSATPAQIDWAVAKNEAEHEVQANIKANDAAWHELGFYFDGVNTVTPVIDRVAQPAHEVAADHANFPADVGLLPHIYIQNGAAPAPHAIPDASVITKTLGADWIRVKQER
ncbi:unnamed protein product, partial [marine sediment metagenome]